MAPYFWKRHLQEKEQNQLLRNMTTGSSSRVGNAASHCEQQFANGQQAGAFSFGHGSTHMSQLNRNASSTQGGNHRGSRPLTFQNPCTEMGSQLIFRANGHSQNLSLGATRLYYSNNGRQKTSKRKFMDEYAGQSSGSTHAEGSSFNPIILNDSENSLNDLGNQTDSDQISNISSSGQPFASLDNGSKGGAFMPLTNTGESNPEVETLMPHLKVIKEFIEEELNKRNAHFTAQAVPSQSAQSVGIGRGASSRSTNVDEAAKRMSEELLKRHERYQQLIQSSRNGNAPTTAHVPVVSLNSRIKTGTTDNTATGRTSVTGHGFSSGHNNAEILGRSPVSVGRTFHIRRINDRLEEISSSDPSVPAFLFCVKDCASTKNNQTRPVSPARPVPVPALHDQVREQAYHSITSNDNWPIPMTVGGIYGRGMRQPETVSAPRQSGGLGISLLSIDTAARNNRRASELELASNRIRTGQLVQAEDAAFLEHSSEVASETEDEDDMVLEHSSEVASEIEDEDALVIEHSSEASDTEDEDILVLEHSSQMALETENEVDTLHNMRLDVDDMTYEELLELQDQIGEVSAGLTVNDAKKRVKLCKYVPSREETGSCCICQEEYQPGKMMGRLMRCGHTFHPPCIRKWLLHKNMCPICKTPTIE